MPEYHHSSGAFTIEVPAGWSVEERVDDTALVLADPVADLGFHPNLVVTVEELPGELDPVAWFRGQIEVVRATLHAARVIDVGLAEVGGWVAQRVLAHHEVNEHAVTLEQWAVPVGPYGWFLSCSVASLSYDHLADLFASLAGSFRLHEAAS